MCRSAGYYEHALSVAQAAKEPEWYLDILLEDCQQYDKALAYLQGLPRQQAAAALTRHGKVRHPLFSPAYPCPLRSKAAVTTSSLVPSNYALQIGSISQISY